MIETCPICSMQTYEPFFVLHDVPVQDGLLWNSRREALNAPTGSIKLAYCTTCAYIGNLLHEPDKIRYDQEYSFSLHFSPTYRQFIDDLARRLADQYNLSQQTILEIGCGQGDFLRQICQSGGNHGIGIDPSTVAGAEQIGPSQITFLQDRYSEKHAALAAKFICCRQVLDQIAHPRAFIELVHKNIGQHRDTAVYFEVPNGAKIFEDRLIRNIVYEKCSWFTAHSLTRLFEYSGFEVLSVRPCFEDDQYLGIEAIPASAVPATPASDTRESMKFEQSIHAFAENYGQEISRWHDFMTSIRTSKQRAIAWGAGSGAISFLSTLKIEEEIPYVVDINPKRQGKFLPLTGQEVVPPAFLVEYRPDVTIITNATYTREIKKQVCELGVECDFIELS